MQNARQVLEAAGRTTAGGFLLAGLILSLAAVRAAADDLPQVEPARLRAAGLRKLESRHLVLFTDLPPGREVDELGEVFDRAVPEWEKYFGESATSEPDWRASACVMKDAARFRSVGLLPADLPNFLHGYARGRQVWVYEQPSAYYRRHLLLHEGSHAFSTTRVGGPAPPWYFEGIAELLGTHRWSDGRLQLDYFPASREEVPEWGRIKIVRDDVAAGRRHSVEEVLEIGPSDHRETGPYGWSWALAAFLDGHPRYTDRFRGLTKAMKEERFNDHVRSVYHEDWDDVSREFALFIAEIDYGYDLVRMAVEFEAGDPLPAGGTTVAVAADRGWQSSGVRVEAGDRVEFAGRGRFTVARTTKDWISEAGGVSVRYYRGRPLGMLLACVVPDEPTAAGGLASPFPIGRAAEWTAEASGTLYFRVNDSPAELDDNSGSLEVEIRR
jgi:hypothetical protein